MDFKETQRGLEVKTIIAGGREYHLTDEDFKKLDQLGDTILVVVS